MRKIIFFLFIVTFQSVIYAQNKSPWEIVNQDRVSLFDKNGTSKNTGEHLLLRLNKMMLEKSLEKNGTKDQNKRAQITIPNREGKLETFLVWESSNFEPELQAKYPDIKAYAGIGVTDPKATLSLSLSPKGLQTMVLRGDVGTEFIESSPDDSSLYVLFSSITRDKGSLPFMCKTQDKVLNKQLLNKASKISANDKVFKTLRLALSCTGEYAFYHRTIQANSVGTIADALAGMNATMTRVNGIFNKDLAVKLSIIANNDLIVYTDAATDPYSESTAGAGGDWSQELQDNLTSVIGNANYDIGHLFGASGGGGNAGCIGCICVAPSIAEPFGKGSAYTSPSDGKPEGDSFDIDFVAHELGHQLGANHTFSHEIEGTGVSVEPGSGSTIMGYAGITSDYDVQSSSDDYFAYASIEQIQTNLSTKTCPVSTVLTNNPPDISAGLDYTIPFGTAFVLKGTGSDAEGDSITYCWEQNDSATSSSGSNSLAVSDKKDGPLFRSLYPSSSATRYLPLYSNVLSNKLTSKWESVSTVARTLHFTLTARDNAALGTAQTNTDEMIVNVSGSIGPFTITSQNTENTTWVQGANQKITWAVNNSNTLKGSENVNIKLSIDGGLTFLTTLIANTPNDGSETITVPSINEMNCRVLIEPTNNIFYAINSNVFAIGYTVSSSCSSFGFDAPFPIVEQAAYTTRTITFPASTGTVSDVNFNVSFKHSYLSDVEMEVVSPQGTTVKLLDRSCGSSNSTLLLKYDDLGGDISCGTTTIQTVAPFQPLAAFNGENPEGTWTFRIRDAYLGDSGTLNSASIDICEKIYTLIKPDFKNTEIISYPNPSKGYITVEFMTKNTDGVKILVHDILGRKIFEKDYESRFNFNENIQLQDVQSGFYFLTIIDGDRRKVDKIVIE